MLWPAFLRVPPTRFGPRRGYQRCLASPVLRKKPSQPRPMIRSAPVAACAESGAWDLAVPIEGVEPCQTCGSLETWWDCNGKPHCQQCEPIRRASRWPTLRHESGAGSDDRPSNA